MPALGALRNRAEAVRVLARAGVLAPERPDRLLGTAFALRRWGLTVPGGFAAAAARYPEAVAVIDDRGQRSYAELDTRTSAIASGLTGRGVGAGSRVAILCRNHAGFVEALVAATKAGADVVLVNTGFAGPQLRTVLEREGADAVIHDTEFSPLLRGCSVSADHRLVAWSEAERPPQHSLEALARRCEDEVPSRPRQPGRLTILTSGTTGAPKGAARSQPRSLEGLAGILSRIPLRSRGTSLIAAPLFHAWGLAHLGLGEVLGSTLILQRSFEPEAVLAAVAEHRADTLVAVPVMLRRLLDVPKAVRSRYDMSSLRVVAVSGAALPGELATAFMDAFGDVLYNLYGSTEVAAASIATPDELRSAPGTVGRPPLGTVVRLLDDRDEPVAAGETGRIVVGNGLLFEGYTNGEGSAPQGGLMATGDMGRFDADGRLFIVGRGDDMIVSGGENVFPGEVEELLLGHPRIADCVVVGVDDEEWGSRLAAYVVRRGRSGLTAEQVRQHVRSKLARYKVPRDVHFVESIPRTPTGKVVKSQLSGG